MALSLRFNFAKRAFALPFFTVLEPSEKSTKKEGKPHKTTLDWSIQMVMQLVRWAPTIPFILVGDGAFACAKLSWTCFKYNVTSHKVAVKSPDSVLFPSEGPSKVTNLPPLYEKLQYNIALVSRLKMNARIYALPDKAPAGKRGRKPKKGQRLISFKEMLKMEDLPWQKVEISGYDGKKKKVKYLTNTSMWGADGFCPIAIRWVLVKDPTGEMDPLPLMSTDVNLTAISNSR